MTSCRDRDAHRILVRTGLTIVLSGSMLAMPAGTSSQPTGRVYRVGYLSAGVPPSPDMVGTWTKSIRALGYIEGQNIIVERRYAHGQLDLLPGLAAELVRLNVELIRTVGTPATLAARETTKTIPILFNVGSDPVQRGYVASYARPGGNLTGYYEGDYGEKRLEILKETIPTISRVSSLCGEQPALSDAGRRLGIELWGVRDFRDLDTAFAAVRHGKADGLIVSGCPTWVEGQPERAGELAARNRLPAIGFHSLFGSAGGLLSFGPKAGPDGPILADYMKRILSGAKPADLPVQGPALFDLVVNLKAAKSLGLTIPASILARATEVIR
jgi:putative ABC transport system substrate-binding protein